MLDWLSQLVSGQATPDQETIALLEQAWRDGQQIDLLTRCAEGEARRISFALHRISPEGLFISKPTVGGVGHRLAPAERFTMCLTVRGQRLIGATQCAKRMKADIQGRTIHGFLLALPTALTPEKKVSEKEAAPLPPTRWEEAAGEAQIIALSTQQPIFGRVIDIDPGKLTIRCRNAGGKIQEGETVELRLSLPHPVGKLNEPMRIARLWTDTRTGQITVDLQPLRMIKEIEQLKAGRNTRPLRRTG